MVRDLKLGEVRSPSSTYCCLRHKGSSRDGKRNQGGAQIAQLKKGIESSGFNASLVSIEADSNLPPAKDSTR